MIWFNIEDKVILMVFKRLIDKDLRAKCTQFNGWGK